jgi:hypothetical protein
MKIFLLPLFFSFILLGCTPENPSNPNNQTTTICPQPKLQFKANGVLYECNAVADSRLGWVGYPRFFKNNLNSPTGNVNAYDLMFCNYKKINKSDDYAGIWVANFPISQNKIIGWLQFYTPNLTTGTYSNSDNSFDFENLNYDYEANENAISLIITSSNNGLVSGTFNGVLPAGTGLPDNDPQITITDGIFSNIPVLE